MAGNQLVPHFINSDVHCCRMGQHSLQALEPVFKAFANRNRLELLQQLQEPRRYKDIFLEPSKDGGGGSSNRAISRQAVRGHLRSLQALGLVVELPGDDRRETMFVVDHTRLFTIVEKMRSLSVVSTKINLDAETVVLEDRHPEADLAGPNLVLVRGVHEGKAYRLQSEPGRDHWTVGRAPGVEVCIDYDPYVSGEHAQILYKGESHFLVDVPDNCNGTYLNWRKMVVGGVAPLQSGDIIGLGMSLFVFRA
jgi:DNA-binding transcriptional ArsR family regulator